VTTILAYDQVLSHLSSDVKKQGIRYGLDHVRHCLAKLGNPEKDLPPTVHIAGTNGKGSTLAFIESGLDLLGYQVGTFTSPHYHHYTERFRLNQTPISEADFAAVFQSLKSQLTDADWQRLTEFEKLTLMGFLWFRDQNLDFVILETGLGGRLDATNVVTPALVCITPIDLDHQGFLGPTLADMATEKAGIIKPGIPVFSAVQAPEVLDILKSVSHQKQAPFTAIPPDASLFQTIFLKSLAPPYQSQNVTLAYAALMQLIPPFQQTKIPLSEWREKTILTGKFQIIQRENQTLILDSAHNPHGIEALMESVKSVFNPASFDIICGIGKTKNAEKMIQLCAKASRSLYYCDFDPHYAMPYDDMVKKCPEETILHHSPQDPLPKSNVLVITGSIYFLAYFLAWDFSVHSK